MKNKICSKYILYVICFMCLNVFDAIRDMCLISLQIGQRYNIRVEDVFPGYKMGDIWTIVESSIGIIMMIIVLSGYKFKPFITKTNAVWTGLCIMAMAVLPYVRTGKYGTILIQEEIAIINIWWIFLVIKQICIKAFIERKTHIKFNAIACLWVALTLCMFFSVSRDRMWPIFYMGMFGCFYLTEYKKEDLKSLFNAMIDGSIWAFVIMQTVACFLRPYDTVRYEMLYSDCNSAALYYLIVFIMLLAKLHLLCVKKSKLWKRVLCVVGQGSVLALLFMTGCRTVWVVTITITFLYCVIVIKRLWNKRWIGVLWRGLVFCVITVVMVFPMYWIVRWGPTCVPARLWYAEEIIPERIQYEVMVGESKNSEKYIELDELVTPLLQRFFNAFILKTGCTYIKLPYEDYTIAASTQGITNVVALQDISSKIQDYSLRERFAIYKAYYEGLTWQGNNPTEQMSVEMRYHAHSLYLQIAYFYGIPAGILLIIIAIALIIYHYKKIMKYEKDPYAIIPFMICLAFFCVGIMGVVWVTGKLILFMLFFTQYPLKMNEEYKNVTEEKKRGEEV